MAVRTGLLGWAEKKLAKNWLTRVGKIKVGKKNWGKYWGGPKKRWANFLLTKWLGARPGLLENKSRMIRARPGQLGARP